MSVLLLLLLLHQGLLLQEEGNCRSILEQGVDGKWLCDWEESIRELIVTWRRHGTEKHGK